MSRPQKLLVATDFSEHARVAEDAALALAARFGAELHWVHALEVPLPIFEPYAVAVPEITLGAARKAAQERLAEAAARAEAQGVHGTIHLGEVPAAYAVADRAQELQADLVVIGTHGHRGIRRMLLGSVAENTVKLAPCSVLTVKGKEVTLPPRRMVVAVDFSDESRRALAVASELATEFAAAICLVHAVEIQVPYVTPYEVVLPDGVLESARGQAAERLKTLRADLPSGVEVTTSVRNGPAHLALVEAAESEGADLILTGSRGLTGLKHALLGSVAERTVRTAPCSVWIVRG